MAVVHSNNVMVAAINFLPTVSEEDATDSSNNDVKKNVHVHFSEKTNKAMCSKDMPVGRQVKKPSISQMVMVQMLKNGMQPVQKSAVDFFFLQILGEGTYSTVYHAREVSSGKEYALKVLNKDLIRRNDKVVSVMREKDVMTSLTYLHGGHPYFVSLYCTFQDTTRLYFAMTYAKNGDLLTHLHRLGSFDDEVTLFYSAEIASAIDFLHKCGIMHRDLKPENILLRENWHIMLSDFGTAKFINSEEEEDEQGPQSSWIRKFLEEAEKAKHNADEGNHRSRSTFVGTAQYLAPEVFLNVEVGPSCDYWALGAIIFQMVSGLPPFRAINDYHIFQKIQKLDYSFPEGFPDLPKDLVQKLLMFEPEKRLGSEEMGGSAAVRSHPYFATVDWDNLLKKTPPALKPYLPASSGEPAFHSDYHIPNNIEPGLDDAALTRLMGIALKDFGSPSRKNSDAKEEKEEPEPAGVRERKLSIQRKEHKYHRFVENNLIVKYGLLDKKRGLFARRRMFLLTEGPHIYYVDPVNMELKGKIPFSRKLRVEAKNFRTFFVHTPSRTYYLFDPERNAVEWCKAIDALREQYLNELPEEPECPDAKGTKRRR